jgi:hypothetical protein
MAVPGASSSLEEVRFQANLDARLNGGYWPAIASDSAPLTEAFG